jgi:hypothetical protein
MARSMRSQRSPLERAAQGRRIEEGNCGKQVNQSDDNYNLSKTEHAVREHSKSGTHCYLRQGTESQSYKQNGPNPFSQPVDCRYDEPGNVIEAHEANSTTRKMSATLSGAKPLDRQHATLIFSSCTHDASNENHFQDYNRTQNDEREDETCLRYRWQRGNSVY